MHAHEQTAISTAPYPLKVYEQFVDVVKHTHVENFFHHIKNIYQNIKFTMDKESNGELAFLDTLLKCNNGKSLY